MNTFKLQVNRILLITIVLFVIAFGFRMWGITKQFEVWDELTVVRYGEEYLNFWKNKDFSKQSWELNKEHPPFSKYFYGATRIVSLNVPYFKDVLDQDYPIGRRYTFQRIVSAFIGSLSIVLVFLLVRKFYSEKVGILSALILSFTPYFLAHSRVATQENLVTFLTLLATLVFIQALYSKKLYNKMFLLSGLILGLAVSTKYNAFFFLVLFAVLALIRYKRDFDKNWRKIFSNYIILVPVITFGVLYMLWPWLWADPVNRFLESTQRLNASRYLEYFLGQFPSPHPWYYFFIYFLATTPPVLLLGIVLFFIKFKLSKGKYDLWFMLYFLTPFLSIFSPLKIDGIRYIFPVYPALAIITGIGFYWFIEKFSVWIKDEIAMIFTFLTPTIVVLILIITAIIYHPYYWDYYNFIFGGPKNVYQGRLFDFGYWGEGIRKAYLYVNKNAEDNSIVWARFVPTHVAPPLRENLGDFQYVGHPNYIIVNPTGEWLNKIPYLEFYPEKFEIIYEDKVLDVPIVKVYKRTKPIDE